MSLAQWESWAEGVLSDCHSITHNNQASQKQAWDKKQHRQAHWQCEVHAAMGTFA